MTTVLALDTCFHACSAALWPGGAAAPVSRCEAMERGHAERLVPMIGELFDEAGIPIASLTHVLVTHGPGSFTGARIGIAAARALALSTGARVAPLSSLRLMALTALATNPRFAATPLAVAIDARRGELYFELFEAASLASAGPALLPAADAARLLPKGTIVVGSGAALVVAEAPDALAISAHCPELHGDARHARFKTEHLLEDAREGPALRPLYLRPPDAKPQTAGSLPRIAP